MSAAGECFGAFSTFRLCLRLPSAADTDALARLMCPEVSARLASWPAPMPAGWAEGRIAEARAAAASRRALPLVVERLSDGTVIGWVGATLTESDPEVATLTYWLGTAFQGHGYMREAAPACLSLAFHHLSIRAVRAAVQPDNIGSRRILRALGMRPIDAGRIWCSARGREEDCDWWEVLHPALREPTLPARAAMERFQGLAERAAARRPGALPGAPYQG
jgi:RimJ/RimL family protein N-acetyltransferase